MVRQYVIDVHNSIILFVVISQPFNLLLGPYKGKFPCLKQNESGGKIL